ncbi:TPM domain-containing protein [Hansschlegelia beijingensis]|uniref:TPM domain-containing protein n=1 Tax=Hansschlegelia beijingensis TaxID=1133344 RepID=A0A7W6GEM1_9HYPH|nr:TPM domain-containing protein [Hansschlegelia beijingensis]MBB3973036.1 uncharacterized protein [Hansschlegelia beijingensis]
MMPTRVLGRLLALTLLVLAAIGPVRADLSFPAFTNYVVDAADVLPPAEEQALIARLKSFQERTGHQFAIATVPSLQGTSVEDFANRLFRAWKLGDAKRNDGALLLVAPADRKVRVEVGYGLEGDLTDAVSRLIIENAILPRFRAGDIPRGIERGADDVMAVFSGQAEDYKARAAQLSEEEEPPVVVDIFMILFLLFFLYVLWRSMRGGGGSSRRHGPWVIGGPGGYGGGWSGGGGGGFGGGGGGSSGGGGASGGW